MGTAVKKAGLGKQLKANKSAYLFMTPFMLCFVVFTVIPVLIAIVYSFTYFDIFNPPQFVGVDNYINLFLNDPPFIKALQNTLVLAMITGPISYMLCFIFAWLVNDLPPKVRAVITFICYAPSLSGSALYVWTIIFSSDQYGFLNSILRSMGIINEPIRWLTDPAYIFGVCIVLALWLSLGNSFLTFVAGLQGVDTSMYEAGAIDGIRNRFQELWYITLPSMKPQLLFGAVMNITAAFTIGDVLQRVVGSPTTDYAAHTLVNVLQDYGNTRYELGTACAVATILFLLMVSCNMIIQKLIRKVGS